MDFGLLIRGMIFGLGAAAPIGPVNVEIARRSLRHGFGAAFALGCGAVTVDVMYALLSSLSIAPLLRDSHNTRPWFYWPMTFAGCGLLVYLGVLSLRGARQVNRADFFDAPNVRPSSLNSRSEPPKTPRTGSGYVTGLLMTGLSPMTLAFWFVVLPKWAGSLTEQPRRDLPIIVLGVFLATIGWVVGFAGLLSFAGRWRRRWWMVAADEIGGVMLIALAAGAFLRSLP